jgi:hypothetical protein
MHACFVTTASVLTVLWHKSAIDILLLKLRQSRLEPRLGTYVSNTKVQLALKKQK